ncbi:hypothetical protein SERLADRAFT_440668 [Serpula lacrymans var. lacrymans S7.9]|uniref:Fungal-type protein kinase domain-containing protein n=1 Tax=Serpula lacrymans var. lacrymans (strain S7.9) TaxID=578457 RepID=F8P3B7_SERL9|nr:uncharacterized protein SERLADRAFT_440668 [Serpula lacrymans var. lacrymans S7.9]EGO22648.1 hypothetical protein SERLADRAFT_440668 [Serpula lacrymans var. lacrymans S7.9]
MPAGSSSRKYGFHGPLNLAMATLNHPSFLEGFPIRRHGTPPTKPKFNTFLFKGPKQYYHTIMDPLIKAEAAPLKSYCAIEDMLHILFPLSELFPSMPGALPQENPLFTAFKCLRQGGLYSSESGKWTAASSCPYLTKPWSPGSEGEVADFLNYLVHRVDQLVDSGTFKRSRWWTSAYAVQAVGDAGGKRRPDLIFISSSDTSYPPKLPPASMRNADSLGELKDREENKASFDKVHKQLMGRLSFVRAAQDRHIYTLGLSIRGSSFTLLYMDQGGSIITFELNLHQQPTLFLHLLLGFSHGSDKCLGYDTGANPNYVRVSALGHKMAMATSVSGQVPVKVLHRDGSISNSLIMDQALSDWPPLKAPEGCAPPNTHIWRGLLADWGFAAVFEDTEELAEHSDNSNEHSNDVSEDSDQDDHYFGLKSGDVQKLQDVYSSDSFLCHNQPEWTLDVAEGTLDDVIQQLSKEGWQGTEPFMAVEVQNAQPGDWIQHTAHHDLESFYYVLLAMCVLMVKPYEIKDADAKEKDDIKKWLNPEFTSMFTRSDAAFHKYQTIEDFLKRMYLNTSPL